MFIYVDESGCSGMKLGRGSSPHFTLTAVVFADQEATRAGRHLIRSLKTSMRWDLRHEFKFNKSSDAIKSRFFEEAVKLDFCFHAFTLNKARLIPGALAEPHKLYRKVASWTFENILNTLAVTSAPSRASVVFDSCGDRPLYEYLEKYLQSLANWKLQNGARLTVTAADSQSEELLQLADMLSGAIGQLHRPDKYVRAEALLKPLWTKRRTFRTWP